MCALVCVYIDVLVVGGAGLLGWITFRSGDMENKGNEDVEKLKTKFRSAWHNVKYSKCIICLSNTKSSVSLFVHHATHCNRVSACSSSSGSPIYKVN